MAEEKNHAYLNLRGRLSNVINATKAGEKLPTEPLLAKQLGVSRATLREAMRFFESKGLIRRRQGVGTFVVGIPQILESGLEVLESIETIAERIGLQVSMDALKIERLIADEEKAANLHIPAGEPLLQVARVIRTRSRPVAYLVDILPANIISDKELDTSFEGSVLDLLLKRGDPEIAYSKTEIQVAGAASDIARVMEIQRGDGLLVFIGTLFDVTGRVIDYSFSYFLPGYFKFNVLRSVRQVQFVDAENPDFKEDQKVIQSS